MSLTEEEEQECKCYQVLSTKPLSDKGQVFDMMARFLRHDRDRQLETISSPDEEENDDDDCDQHDHDDQSNRGLLNRDLVREKATWDELRRWTNVLREECLADSPHQGKRRKPIGLWTGTTPKREEEEEEEADEDDNQEERSNLKRHRKNFRDGDGEEEVVRMEVNLEEKMRHISEELVKAETIESTGRAEVSILGRTADESFQDQVDLNENSSNDDDDKELRRAMKKEKKAAKKAKKLAKKEKKKESKKKNKKRKREETEE